MKFITSYCTCALLIFYISTSLIHQSYGFAFNIKSFVKQIARLPRKVGQYLGISETCSNKWIRTNKDGLKLKLEEELFGQPIVQAEIPEIFSKHWENLLDSNNLFISFYGTPGTGKTYTTQLLSKYIFNLGGKSYYYQFFNGAESDISEEGLNRLKDEMNETIKNSIEECPFTIIVFDEVDKYPKGFLDDIIMPFVKNSNGKATFIFITNVGSIKLMERSLEIEGSYFMYHNFGNYDYIKDTLLYTATDSFFLSDLVQSGLVKFFIPFLPHKKESFTKCLEKTLLSFNSFESLKSNIISAALKDIVLIPESNPMYVASGCKRLKTIISTVVTKLKRSKMRPDEL